MPFDRSVSLDKLQFDTVPVPNCCFGDPVWSQAPSWAEPNTTAEQNMPMGVKVFQIELAEDIERLARLAYPDAPASMIEALAKDQFLDALSQEELQMPAFHPTPIQP